jgi:hypothetical protein
MVAKESPILVIPRYVWDKLRPPVEAQNPRRNVQGAYLQVERLLHVEYCNCDGRDGEGHHDSFCDGRMLERHCLARQRGQLAQACITRDKRVEMRQDNTGQVQ